MPEETQNTGQEPYLGFDESSRTKRFVETKVNPRWMRVSDISNGRTVQVKAIDDVTVVTTGDAKMIFFIPEWWAGLALLDVDAYITTASSSGTPTIQIRNITQAQDMLSTAITIDATPELSSLTAAAQPVIDRAKNEVASGDQIAIDVDVAGTGAKGLGVVMIFG